MKIIESPPDPERQNLINAVTQDAANLLGVHPNNDSPQAITTKVNEAIVAIVTGEKTPMSSNENPDLLLGALWGAQMVRQFDWHWADVTVDDSIREVSVISPNQGMIIFPFSFTAMCLERKCICTVLLSFNMLLANDRTDEIKPGSYENIMLSIHHIVPPYTLENIG